MRSWLTLLVVCSVLITGGCRQGSPDLRVSSESSPAPAGSLVPQMTPLSGGRILLSWQHPLPGGGYAFEMAVKDGSRWSDVRTIARGANLSMYSADLPAVATLAGTKLLAYWEVKAEGHYATTIETAVSNDEGRTWVPAATPYHDALPGQHSFLSWFETRSGIGLLWLDAKVRSQVQQERMQEHGSEKDSDLGSVGLRYAAFNADGKVDQEQFVVPITCECCPTSAAVTSRGPVAVFRGRQEAPGTHPSEVRGFRPTVRDIYLVRQENGVWQEPHLVHNDNWIINACPDNGPAVDASGNRVAVAWWTASNDQPKVHLAFSSDSGDTFGPPFRIDSANGEGQVTVALLPNGRSAIVGWLEDGKTWARYVSESGAMSRPMLLGPSPHHSRLPRWLANPDGSVAAAWTSKKDGETRLEISRIGVEHAD